MENLSYYGIHYSLNLLHILTQPFKLSVNNALDTL